MEGYLEIKKWWGRWTKSYLVLVGDNLSFYTKPESNKPKKVVQLANTAIREAKGITNTDNTIGIFGYPSKPIFLKAASKAEMESWLSAMKVGGFLHGIDISKTLECINDAVVITDKLGMIVSFNGAAEQLFGHEKIDVLGKNVKMLMNDEVARVHDAYLHNFNVHGIKRLIGNIRVVSCKHAQGYLFNSEISLGELQESNFIATFRKPSPTPTPASTELSVSNLSSLSVSTLSLTSSLFDINSDLSSSQTLTESSTPTPPYVCNIRVCESESRYIQPDSYDEPETHAPHECEHKQHDDALDLPCTRENHYLHLDGYDELESHTPHEYENKQHDDVLDLHNRPLHYIPTPCTGQEALSPDTTIPQTSDVQPEQQDTTTTTAV